MVKTKPVAKKKPQPKKEEAPVYRPKGDWWDDIMSGETCRTADFDKVIVSLGRARDCRKGLTITAQPELQTEYAWYITLLATQEDTVPPSKKGKKK